MFCFCGVLSGTGMTLSTILYNTAGSVGEANFHAFIKTHGVNKALMYVNDASIWSFNFLCLAFCLTFCLTFLKVSRCEERRTGGS